ncbi:PF20097 family protein [uncultured Dysosmobacter sp.]|uniref:PF20097 family protein n=1 Tax=uncultured Dysosmobacter sp. TaxID=2591384 RepID=UPI00345E04F4
MQCPYCGQEMEKGLIQSPQEISWIKSEKRTLFGRAEFYDGAVVLSKLSVMKGSAVVSHLCRDCQKVIIDFFDGNSDLNQS